MSVFVESVIMDNISVEYAHYIDELRRESRIRVNDFCDGICSDRQYRRYISGEQSISQKNIIMFSEKLGLNPSDFFSGFYKHDKKESQAVNMIYDYISINDFDNTYKEIDKLKKYKFLNIQSKRFYEFCIIKANYITNKITMNFAYDKFKELINYPICLDKKTFDFVDIATMHWIAHIEFKLGKDDALKFLYKVLFDRSLIYVSSYSRYILPAVYSAVAKILGMSNKIDEAERIASIGIEYCLKISDIRVLPHLYYVKALSLLNLGKVNLGMVEAKKCIAATIAKNNDSEIKLFHRLIEEDFRINPLDLFKDGYIK